MADNIDSDARLVSSPIKKHGEFFAANAKHHISCEIDSSSEAYIGVIYVGGTIGMKVDACGSYVPVPGHLFWELKKLPMFNDPAYTVKLTPTNTPHEENVYVPLATPMSTEGKRVIYSIIEFDPLLDSSNMSMDDYAAIATYIKDNYTYFDGFVVLHGTDTMSYTASALSFMLENLGKPVVLTGSQVPIFEILSDGRDNLLGALHVAGHYCIAEVSLYFNKMLYRGNRSSKIDSAGYDCFASPNLTPLVTMGTTNKVHWDIILAGSGLKKMIAYLKLCSNVGILWLFPSITVATVSQFLQPPMQGVALVTYGAGNCPSNRKDLMHILQSANDRGVIIVNITQCRKGHVSPSYATGKALMDVGVLPGFDMTPEAALTKLSYVLGRDDWDLSTKREMMQQNLRGELTSVTGSKRPPYLQCQPASLELVSRLCQAMALTADEEIEHLRNLIYPVLLCTACQQGDLEAVKKLHQLGAVLSMADYDGRTPLHLAASGGYLNVVVYLLENGAMLHTKDKFGRTALIDAVQSLRYDVIKTLVNGGATVRTSFTPARMASELCQLTMVGERRVINSWLMAGADINSTDYDGRSPLHVAVSRRDMHMAQFLVDLGARTDLVDFSGKSALKYAEELGSLEMLDILCVRASEESAGPDDAAGAGRN